MSPAPVKVGAEVQTISIEVIIELFGCENCTSVVPAVDATITSAVPCATSFVPV